MTKRKGEFEACFAKGLDLSEFTTSATTTTTTSNTTSGVLPTNVASSSHSARLLQIKQVEAAMKKFENDQEEVKTQNLIAARSGEPLKLQQVASKANQNRPYSMQLPAPPSHSAVKSTNETVHSNISNSISNRNIIRNVLVGMHEETIQKGYDHMPRKMLSKRHPHHDHRKSSQKPITKKTTRRKY